jgi:hypothetical protein
MNICKRGRRIMVYYYRKNGEEYHMCLACSKIPGDVFDNSTWVVSNAKPDGKEKCDECKNLMPLI